MPAIVTEWITVIRGEAQYAAGVREFADVCAANQDLLGLTAPQLAEIEQAASKFNQKLDAWVLAKATADQAKTDKDEQFTTTRSIVNSYARQFRANMTIPNAILSQLKVAPHDPPKTTTPAITPAGFDAQADGNGAIFMKWKPNGNVRPTTYQVQYQTTQDGPWMILGTTTKSKFQTQWTAGEFIGLRIVAVRGNSQSLPTTPVALWYGSQNVVMLKAA